MDNYDDTEVITPGAPVIDISKDAEIMGLTVALRTMTVDRDGKAAALTQARHDLDVVCEAIYSAAVDRDWCDEYDEFVDEVNRSCHGTPMRVRDTEVEYTCQFTMTVKKNEVDKITLSDLASALEQALHENFSPEDVSISVKKDG